MNTVLIIDDSIFNINFLTILLQDKYRIISTVDGYEGVEFALIEQPDIILLDINLPNISGFEVLAKLRSDPRTEIIPVIFLTSVSDPEIEEQAFSLGAVDYIRKPFHPNVVKARVRTHISIFMYRKLIETELAIDTLTGLHTRKHFDNYFKEQYELSRQNSSPLSIAMVDIDNFKCINDTYGHGEGDSVLRTVALTIKDALPDDNRYVARWGGEEFVIILPNTSEHEAKVILENVRCVVEERVKLPCRDSSAEAKYVTLSIGGSTLTADSNFDINKLLQNADEKMYTSKQMGKNRLTWG